jgi:hypothetical protein
MAMMTDAFIVHLRDPGSNLGIDRKYFLSVCVTFEFKSVRCLILLVSTNNVGFYFACYQKTLNTICMWRGPILNVILNCTDSTHCVSQSQ